MSHSKTFLAAHLVRRLLEDIFLESDTNLNHAVQVRRIRLILACKTEISNSTKIRSVMKLAHWGRKCKSHSPGNSQIEYQPHTLLDWHPSLPAAERTRLLVQGLENQVLDLGGCVRTLLLALLLLLLLLLLLHLLHHSRSAHAHLLLEVRRHFESGRGRATLLQRGGPTRMARDPP